MTGKKILLWFICGMLHLWSAAAVFYCVVPALAKNLRFCLALAYLVIIFSFVLSGRRKNLRLVISLAGFVIMALFYLSIKPRINAVYPAYLKPAYVVFDGSQAAIYDVRNDDYRTKDDFDIRYEPRAYGLDSVRTLDAFINFWGPKSVAHVFLSFGFTDGRYLAVSVEFRPELGESYDLWAGIFKRYELIYIWGDERDLVRARTNYRNEEVYIYRVRMSREDIRKLLVSMLNKTNQLYKSPEFYNTLTHSCTNTLVRHTKEAGIMVIPFWKQHIFTGDIDLRSYNQGWFYGDELPFEELRAKAKINAIAEAADKDPEFSQKIRAGLSLN